MLVRIRDAYDINIGAILYRYIAKTLAYDRGEVKYVDNHFVHVDFGDSLRQFRIDEISFTANTQDMIEHYTTLSLGTEVEDFRGRPHPIDPKDVFISDMEDLLKSLG